MSKPDTLSIPQIIALLRPSYAEMTHTRMYTDIARRLSILASKSPAWSWRYIQGVHAGTIQPSVRLITAARSLLSVLHGEIPKDFERISIRSSSYIAPGAWVLAGSRACKNPACPIIFVPKVPNQVYCPLCRINAKRGARLLTKQNK